MNIEIILAFAVGAIIATIIASTGRRGQPEISFQSLVSWLREAHQSGVAIKIRKTVSTTSGGSEEDYELVLDVDLKKVDRHALELCRADKKILAIKLVRRALDLDLRGAKEHVEALMAANQ